MYTHTELKKIIKENNLVSSIDLIIACDNHGWTDLRFTRLDERLNNESKYFLALNIKNEPHILYYNNLYQLRKEIEDKMVLNSYVKGYDPKNNRVHLHYEGEGTFRIGNKDGPDIFRVQFEECTLKELAKRRDYKMYFSLLKPDERHRSMQTLLCELGISLGYSVKLASNDKSPIITQCPSLEESHKLLVMSDFILSNIKEKQVERDIDLIDVIWFDKINNRIVMAFEVEFGRDYAKVYEKFCSLSEMLSYRSYFVGVGNNYASFNRNLSRPV
jgi:hypothetical protein